ncbi:hypothetical protein [Erythrobacter sp. JK5]|uniref:RipA family octameric membrane protein n=1 Tax=Erythrobacter sp. JK5 TaxID=2829500 RepID=UPI001BA7D3D5|nr:hypothetical protein [Erythrobacter sp. JK5]QUL37597.1 hypothetical protein KDC96_14820 [Erythrobacter sp. JK5]
MTTNRDTYFGALGLSPPGAKSKGTRRTAAGESSDRERDARLAALTRSHEIRQFEIELYWKRANYFWLLQGAVFAAIGLIWRDASGLIPSLLPVGLAALGAVTALAGWLSSQGSKFWQENWEHHIDMLEDEFEGRLHKTAYVGKKGIRWSVSGVNDRLALCFWIFWLFVLLVATSKTNPNWTLDPHKLTLCPTGQEVGTIACWLFAIGGSLYIRDRTSDMHGKDVAYPEGTIELKQGDVRPYLFRREPKI